MKAVLIARRNLAELRAQAKALRAAAMKAVLIARRNLEARELAGLFLFGAAMKAVLIARRNPNVVDSAVSCSNGPQ